MSIADYNTYKSRRDNPNQRIRIAKQDGNLGGYDPVSLWINWGGATPTTAVAPTEATAGALGQSDPSGTQRLLRFISSFNSGANTASSVLLSPGGSIVLYDRLSHQGGLSGTSTSSQTTNLPTAALTRKTSGTGVIGALEIYTALGSTTTTITVSYTNHAGTASRTSQTMAWGGTGTGGAASARHMNFIPLQAGDKGIRAVASVTAAGTTGTVGNFGVTLLYPLLVLPVASPRQYDSEALFGFGTWFPEVEANTCITAFASMSQFLGAITAEFHFSED